MYGKEEAAYKAAGNGDVAAAEAHLSHTLQIRLSTLSRRLIRECRERKESLVGVVSLGVKCKERDPSVGLIWRYEIKILLQSYRGWGLDFGDTCSADCERGFALSTTAQVDHFDITCIDDGMKES